MPPAETLIHGGFQRVLDPCERTVWSLYRLKRELGVLTGLRRHQLRRLLRAAEARVVPMAVVEHAPPGRLLRVVGKVVPLVTNRAGAVWWIIGGRGENRTVVIETGYDFLLDDGTAEPVRVLAAGGHLLDTTHMRPGEYASVVGFVDRLVDPTAGRRGSRSVPLRSVLRSGDGVPLLIRPSAPPVSALS